MNMSRAFQNRELEQAVLRIVLGMLLGGYLIYAVLVDEVIDPDEQRMLQLLVSYYLVAIGIAWHVFRYSCDNPPRRILGIVLDTSAATMALYYGEEMGMPMYAVYLWVTVGNGFRYGTRYLILSAVLSASGFIAMVAASPYWQAHPAFVFGLLLTLIAIPPYLGGLLRRLEYVQAQLEQLAHHDALTGIYNRRSLEEKLAHEFARCERYQDACFALLMFDIDHFKHVNDTYGHPAGDEVIRAVARTSLSVLRVTDIVARYGGEEFVAILPGVSGEGATIAAERLRSAIERQVVEYEGRAIQVTISLGVVSACDLFDSYEQLLNYADEGLYRSKQSGRNRAMLNNPVQIDEKSKGCPSCDLLHPTVG